MSKSEMVARGRISDERLQLMQVVALRGDSEYPQWREDVALAIGELMKRRAERYVKSYSHQNPSRVKT